MIGTQLIIHIYQVNRTNLDFKYFYMHLLIAFGCGGCLEAFPNTKRYQNSIMYVSGPLKCALYNLGNICRSYSTN